MIGPIPTAIAAEIVVVMAIFLIAAAIVNGCAICGVI